MITSIGTSAFRGCATLRKFKLLNDDIDDNRRTADEDAFCSKYTALAKLCEISFPTSLTNIIS